MLVSSRVAICALALACVCLAIAPSAHADVFIGTGSTVHFADAKVDLGCGNLGVGGSADATSAMLADIAGFSLAGGAFTLGAGTLSLGGDFSNAGTFAAGTGQVLIEDACGSGISRITGSNAFYDLLVGSSVGKQLVFPAGLAQSVAHTFALQGIAGNLLQVLSSTPGTKARLGVAAGAVQTIAYVDARDNDASSGATIAPGAPAIYNSVNAGDLVNWFSAAIGANGGAVPAPALAHSAMLLLAALFAAFAWRRRRAS